MRIAIRASNHYLRDLLVLEGYRSIAEHVRRVKALALTQFAKRIYVELGIDVLDAIPYDPAIFPAEYTEVELPNMLRQIDEARHRTIVQYHRFACGPIHECHNPAMSVIDPRRPSLA